MAVNYILYVIFITTTIAYIYFAIQLNRSKNQCSADILSDKPVAANLGRDIKANFVWDFYIGSICGILEIIRNSLHLWAKCFRHYRAALIFNVLSFITAFLFAFNFVNLQLDRYTHNGRVCSGDFLSKEEAKNVDKRFYLTEAGFFIHVMILVYYGMIGLIVLSICCVALTLRFGQKEKY